MPKRQPKNMVPISKRADTVTVLRKALAQRRKADLVDVLMELAQADRGILRRLIARFDAATAPEELVAATRQAIADATSFDKRDINRNFAYDYEAYREVKGNLSRLIDLRQLPLAMQLSLELMKAGSYQVEMSDEGLMTADVEDCLNVVIKALAKCDQPAEEVIAWCSAMHDSDRVGFIAEQQLQSLRHQLQTAATR
jgi:hypothetical protein